MAKHNYEELLKDIKEIREATRKSSNPETDEVLVGAALRLLASEEFGNFVSLSTMYKQLEDVKK